MKINRHEPGNHAGSVTGTNFVVCQYGKFQPGRPRNPRNTIKMVEHKLVSSPAVVALWTPVRNFTNKAHSHTPKVEPYKTKILPFWPLCCESEAAFRRSIAKTEISVTGPARLFIWTHFTKERVARRDLGNWVSPVDWAHVKRPSFAF